MREDGGGSGGSIALSPPRAAGGAAIAQDTRWCLVTQRRGDTGSCGAPVEEAKNPFIPLLVVSWIYSSDFSSFFPK